LKNNLTTAAGPAKQAGEAHRRKGAGSSAQAPLIDAINQAFALFQLNYHNQYHKAYGTGSNLNHAKRLWLEMLGRFEPQAILRAAKAVIETSEYLPTLRTMIKYCEEYSDKQSLPDPHSAYIEACRAPSPKSDYAWSHPAVYHAGKASDWYFLLSSPESVAYPIFKAHYQELCAQVRGGAVLDMPATHALPAESETPLDSRENAERLSALRDQLGL
jgi:hypothetical protein